MAKKNKQDYVSGVLGVGSLLALAGAFLKYRSNRSAYDVYNDYEGLRIYFVLAITLALVTFIWTSMRGQQLKSQAKPNTSRGSATNQVTRPGALVGKRAASVTLFIVLLLTIGMLLFFLGLQLYI